MTDRAANPPTLATARLTLSPPVAADAAAVAAQVGDPAVSHMLARVPYPYAPADALDFIAYAATLDPPGVFAIRLGTGLIGMISVEPRGDALPEFGYWLGRAHWGQGYATEAGRALLAHAFATTAHATIKSGAFVDNPASARVLVKLGFEPAGHDRLHCVARGREVDRDVFTLTRDRWAAVAHPTRIGQ